MKGIKKMKDNGGALPYAMKLIKLDIQIGLKAKSV